METLFQIVNVAVLPFWLLMILTPRWGWTRRIMGSPVVPALFAGLYVVLLVPFLPAVLPLLVRPTLAGVAEFLGRPEATLVGWVHFLTFDLFVGRWQYLDAQQRRLSHWLLAPALVLTLMFGPLGLLTYLLLRWLAVRAAPSSSAAGNDR
jgi:hypothetical protein